MDKMQKLDQICGLVYGQALGDAFGLTTEFLYTKNDIKNIITKNNLQCKDQFPYPYRTESCS